MLRKLGHFAGERERERERERELQSFVFVPVGNDLCSAASLMPHLPSPSPSRSSPSPSRSALARAITHLLTFGVDGVILRV
ncbi:hypothetical protein M758_1G298700 [Ceratodon purpureus]|nr:hypothetical protein M758_1G298700 [Ceratodon purpureus]